MNRDLPGALGRHLLGLILAAMPLLSHAIEEPDYEVIRKVDQVELRQYAPYVVAEVVLNARADEAGNQAFPILAGYIFGKNKGEKTLAMTAPVTETATPVRMQMTAPVTQSNYEEHLALLRVALDKAGVATQGEPVLARYNAPLTPWFLRRNEIWLALP